MLILLSLNVVDRDSWRKLSNPSNEDKLKKEVEEEIIKCTVTEGQLDDTHSNILEEFGELLVQEEAVPITRLRMSAAVVPMRVKKDLKDQREAIMSLSKAADVIEFIGHLNLHSDYLKPSLLEHMIDKYGHEELKTRMRRYKEDLNLYRKTTKLNDIVGVEKGSINPDDRALVERLVSLCGDKGLKDLVQFQKNINIKQFCEELQK